MIYAYTVIHLSFQATPWTISLISRPKQPQHGLLPVSRADAGSNLHLGCLDLGMRLMDHWAIATCETLAQEEWVAVLSLQQTLSASYIII